MQDKGYYDSTSGLTYALTKTKITEEKKEVKKILKKNKSSNLGDDNNNGNVTTNLVEFDITKTKSECIQPSEGVTLSKYMDHSNFSTGNNLNAVVNNNANEKTPSVNNFSLPVSAKPYMPKRIITKKDNKNHNSNKNNSNYSQLKTYTDGIKKMDAKSQVYAADEKNNSEYRENRKFKNEKLGEHQLYFYSAVGTVIESLGKNSNIIKKQI